jgi:hypothetical protein
MSASRVPSLQAVDINQYLAERLILCCSVKEQMVEQPCCDTKQPWYPYLQAIQRAFCGWTQWSVATGRARSLTAYSVKSPSARPARRERGLQSGHGLQTGCFQFPVRYPSPLKIAQRKAVGRFACAGL